MPVEIAWDDELQTRIMITFLQFWSWKEVDKMLAAGNKLLENGADHPVDVIVDGTQTMTLIKADSHIRTRTILEQAHSHPRIQRIVIVGSGAITNSFLTLFIKISTKELNPSGYAYFGTVEEARAYLRGTDGL